MADTSAVPASSKGLSVGAAKRALEKSRGNLIDRSEVQGVGVGLRDNQQTFIVTVADADAREKFRSSFAESTVGGMPLKLEISSICESSADIQGLSFDTSLLPQLSLKQRIANFWQRLASIWVP